MSSADLDRIALVLLGLPWLLTMLGCKSDPAPPAPPPAPPEVVDVHVHLLSADAAAPLLQALDRHGIGRAVLLGSVGASPSAGPGRFRAGNEAVLVAAAGSAGRLVPFVALEPGQDGAAELAEYRRRGACGVKLYAGHQDLHEKPMDDPSYTPLWKALEEQRVPTLVHVNTVRYADEFDRVLSAHPGLSIVCAHFCGARTELGPALAGPVLGGNARRWLGACLR